MRPITVTADRAVSPFYSAVIPVQLGSAPTNIGIAVIVTGTVTYSVQHTFDDVFSPTFDPSTAIWFDHPTLVAQTTNKDGNYSAPPRGIRVNATAGTGSVRMVLTQSGVGAG